LVGRHPECDIRIDDPQVSRRHCCFAQAYDRLTVRDLGSRNGVRVNGRLVAEFPLRPGDEVAISHFIYRIEDDDPYPAPASPGTVGVTPPKPPPSPISPSDLPVNDSGYGDIGLLPLDDD
jgi:predicted component of type VI protein secretion system